MRLTLEGEFVMLDVADGVGFDASADTFGFGLSGMRERLTALPLARATRPEVVV